LEIILKKVTRNFKVYKIVAISFSTLLIVVSMLKFFNSLDWGNMNKAGLLITSTIIFIINANQHFKIKTNLENKIWLIRLLNRVEKE